MKVSVEAIWVEVCCEAEVISRHEVLGQVFPAETSSLKLGIIILRIVIAEGLIEVVGEFNLTLHRCSTVGYPQRCPVPLQSISMLAEQIPKIVVESVFLAVLDLQWAIVTNV